MARTKRGVVSRAKHKKVLKTVKGQYGRRKNTIRIARQAMEKAMGEPERAGLVWRANINAEVSEEQAASVLKLIDALEEDDDVQAVTANFDLPDEVVERLLGAA